MLEEKILNDYKEAMKARDTLKSSVLSFLRAQVLNTALAQKKNKLEDGEVLAVIKKQVKEREDSIEQFRKGNRLDLADKEAKELGILKTYLPVQLSREELQKIIVETVIALEAKDMKDMGRVMKEVNAKAAGAADGRMMSEMVQERLQKSPS